MKEVRIQIDRINTGVVERIHSLINIEGEANYKEFVNKLNARVSQYKQILAQRKGRAQKQKGLPQP